MNLRSRAILSTFITVALIGLGILIWSYRTGRITIFGSISNQQYTAIVTGSKLNEGNPDQHINLVEATKTNVNFINNRLELGTEQKDTTAYLKAKISDTESIDEQFIGIRTNNSQLLPGTAGNTLDPIIANFFSNQLLSISKNSSAVKIRNYDLNIRSLINVNPEVVFKTDEGQKEVAKLFWDLNGIKEKYLGLNLFDWANLTNSHPSSGDTSVCSIGSTYWASKNAISSTISSNDPNKISRYPVISLGGKAHWGGCSDGLPLPSEWNNNEVLTYFWQSTNPELTNPNSKIRTEGKAVIAKNNNSANMESTPRLFWENQDKGDYIGMATVKGIYYGATGTPGAIFLTSTGVVGDVYHRDYQESDFAGNVKVAAKLPVYYDSGTYTYSVGSENVTKFIKFKPVSQTIPEGTEIKYEFAGSSNGKDWSELSSPALGSDDITTNGINLDGKIPSGSKYIQIKITFANKAEVHILDTPTIDGFNIDYEANPLTSPTPTPSDDHESPSAPSNVTIITTTTCPSQDHISWTAATDNVAIGGYEILDGPNTNSTVIATLGASTLSYTIGNISEGQTKDYYVRAFDTASPKNYSSSIKVTQIGHTSCQSSDTPSEPRELIAKTTNCRSVELNWKAPTSGTASSYLLYNADANQMITSLSGSKTSQVLSNLSGGVKYRYYLKAMGSNNGLSAKSNTIEVTTSQCSPVQLNPEPDQIYSLASESGTNNIGTQLASVGKLVSTGAALWFNILAALLFGGVISWLMLRKK